MPALTIDEMWDSKSPSRLNERWNKAINETLGIEAQLTDTEVIDECCLEVKDVELFKRLARKLGVKSFFRYPDEMPYSFMIEGQPPEPAIMNTWLISISPSLEKDFKTRYMRRYKLVDSLLETAVLYS